MLLKSTAVHPLLKMAFVTFIILYNTSQKEKNGIHVDCKKLICYSL